MSKTLEWTNGHVEMNVATLKKTCSYNYVDFGGKRKYPPARPVEHHEFLDVLTEIASPVGEVEWEPIICTERNALVTSWEGDPKECPIGKVVIQQFVTKALIKDEHANGTCAAMGVSFSEKGISVAFGQNVSVCANMCVFGDNVLRTGSMKYSSMMEVINSWFREFETKAAIDRENVELLKSIGVSDGYVDNIFGELIKSAVLANEGVKESILNVAQTGKMIRQYQKQIIEEGNPQTLWGLLNCATEEMKATNTDQTKIWQMHNKVSNYFMEKGLYEKLG